ncbi:MAG: NUDIX hydrolase [Oceanospirillaceae bacterium]|nr:NUDIX hydrolase [Oceanospirillaceae bacterium]
MADFPWKRLTTRPVYDNPWLTIEEDQVLKPNGQPGIYGKVLFKNRAVAILPVDGEYNLYLVGQSRYMQGRFSWEVPKGGAPRDEDLLACAQRELNEETGLQAENWLTLMTDVDVSNSVTDELAYVYLATGLTQGQSCPEDSEDISVRKVSLAAALHMCLQGEITCLLSIAAILRLRVLHPHWFGEASAHENSVPAVDVPAGPGRGG